MRKNWLAAVWVVVALSTGTAWAKDNGNRNSNDGADHAATRDVQQGYFGDRDREAVRDYYADAARGGHCPPGLAKKNNGCLPPGQAKKRWVVGQPLPPAVVYAPVPSALVVQLTPPPVGYRYVQVSGDILMISAGTRMVVDAIKDLGR